MTGSLAINVEGTTSGLQSAMVQGADVTTREMQRIKRAIEYATTALKDIEKAQQQANKAASDQTNAARAAETITKGAKAATVSVGQLNNALRQTPSQFTDIVTQLAGGQSPFLILIQQGGQLRDMFGGFGNMFRGLASFITPASVAIGAVAASVGTLAYAYAQGRKEQEEFNKALRLTGNYSGQTTSTFDALAKSIQKNADVSIGSAKELAQAMTASGSFGPNVLNPLALAMAKVQQVSGKTADEVVSDFARMGDGVAKWAIEHNKQYHFLTAAQFEYIKDLEEQGKTEQAELETAKALYSHLGGTAPEKLGTLEKAWQGVTGAVSAAWEAMKSIGKDDTIDQRIASLQKSIESNRQAAKQAAETGKAGGIDNTAYIAAANGRAEAQSLELVRLQEQKLREEAAARGVANRQAYEESIIKAKQYTDKLADEAKGTDLVTKKLTEYRRQVDALKGTKFAVSSDEQKRVEAQIKKSFDPDSVKSANKLQSEFDSTAKALDEQRVKAQADAEEWKKYGKSVDDSQAALMRYRTTVGDLKDLGSAQKATLISKAESADAAKQADVMAKETAQATKLVEALEKEATARQQSEREMFIEQKTRQALGNSQDAELKKRAQNAAALEYDTKRAEEFRKSLDTQTIAIDKEIAGIASGTKLIGLNTLQREEAADVIKVQALAQQQVSKYIEKEAEINEWAATKIRELTAAREKDYTDSRKFATGMSKALAQYQEDAGDSAKFAESYITGSFSKMEDALTKFVTTGKLSFSDLFTYMFEEYARQLVKMQLASSSGSIGSLLGSVFGSYLSSNTGVATTVSNSLSGDSLDNLISVTNGFGTIPGHANGLSYVPRDNYIARLHEGERVLTKQEAKAQAGGSISVNPVYNIAAGVSRSDLMAGLEMTREQTKTDILQSMRHNGVFVR